MRELDIQQGSYYSNSHHSYMVLVPDNFTNYGREEGEPDPLRAHVISARQCSI